MKKWIISDAPGASALCDKHYEKFKNKMENLGVTTMARTVPEETPCMECEKKTRWASFAKMYRLTSDQEVKIYGEYFKEQWSVMCLDFCLAAQGDTEVEALAILHAMLKEHLEICNCDVPVLAPDKYWVKWAKLFDVNHPYYQKV